MEWRVPGHGEFVTSKFGSRLWMSPDDELPPTVSGGMLAVLMKRGTFVLGLSR
jgi:hypothetical protein